MNEFDDLKDAKNELLKQKLTTFKDKWPWNHTHEYKLEKKNHIT